MPPFIHMIISVARGRVDYKETAAFCRAGLMCFSFSFGHFLSAALLWMPWKTSLARKAAAASAVGGAGRFFLL